MQILQKSQELDEKIKLYMQGQIKKDELEETRQQLNKLLDEYWKEA